MNTPHNNPEGNTPTQNTPHSNTSSSTPPTMNTPTDKQKPSLPPKKQAVNQPPNNQPPNNQPPNNQPPSAPPKSPKSAKTSATSPAKTISLPAQASIWQIADAALRQPSALGSHCQKHPNQGLKVTLSLSLVSLIALAAFGFILGQFIGGNQLWAAPLKVPLIGFASSLLCLPSLYVFAALANLDLDIRAATLSILSILTRISLLLLGFAPLAWLFAVSVSSLYFYGSIILSLSLISTLVGLRINQSNQRGGIYMFIWSSIFVLVTLQMPTSLRPIINSSDTFLPQEKQFFLETWVTSGATTDQTNTQNTSTRISPQTPQENSQNTPQQNQA